jgi:hypothetical protein
LLETLSGSDNSTSPHAWHPIATMAECLTGEEAPKANSTDVTEANSTDVTEVVEAERKEPEGPHHLDQHMESEEDMQKYPHAGHIGLEPF